jgi:aminopeptidase N
MITVLNESQAAHRSSSIESPVEYDIYLHLEKGKDYNGAIRIQMKLKKTKDLFLDFAGKNVLSLQINSHPAQDLSEEGQKLFKEGKLHLPEEQLKIGENCLVVKFQNEYNTDGNGLHTFTDTDGQQYVYCQNEPYWFNRVLPIFDQPDLKGTNRFHILHPKDWKVVSNELPHRSYVNHHDFAAENRIKTPFESYVLESFFSSDFKQESQTFSIFKQSQLMSTYLFCFVAGPYEKHALPEDKRYNNIIMNFYCRKSKTEFGIAQSGFMFECLIESIKFLEKFFGYKYPYEKWDFIMCPEFTVGAMEFPGCVTFNDLKFIYESNEVPIAFRSYVARVIIHELAHMWFGNLVTMKWWDGLWLNESFADFCSFLTTMFLEDKLSHRILSTDVSIYHRKKWGYDEDSKTTTHPIACDICDTNKADSIFDGITYSKGMSVLMQLYHRIGFEKFSKNMSNYINEYKFKNTQMIDLFRHLENGIDTVDMKKWIAQWLLTGGMNSIRPEWDPNTQGSQVLEIYQDVVLKEHPTLREHMFDITFFNVDGKAVHTQNVIIQNESVSKISIENKEYKAVLLNSTDKDFVRVYLDQNSKAFFQENLWKLESHLFIIKILDCFMVDVLEGNLRADIMLKLCVTLLDKSINKSDIVIDLPKIMEDCLKCIPSKNRKDLKSEIFQVASKCSTLTEEKDKLIALKEIMILSAVQPQDIMTLYKLLDANNPLRTTLCMSVRDDCQVHVKVLSNTSIDQKIKDEILQVYQKENLGNILANNKLFIEAMVADEVGRANLWEKEYFSLDRTLSYFKLEYSLKGFIFGCVKKGLKANYSNDFFRDFPKLLKSDSKEISKTVFNFLCPSLDDDPLVISKIDKLLEEAKALDNQFFVDLIQKKRDTYLNTQKSYKLFTE